MKKLIISIVTLSTVASFCIATQQRPNWEATQKTARYAVVHVINHQATPNIAEPFGQPKSEQEVLGTAFFINEDGDLLTNYHVVEHARKLEISLPDVSHKRFTVTVVGCKPTRDIALVTLTDKGKKEFKKLLESVPGCNGRIQYLKLADPDALPSTGELMALGYPLEDSLKHTIGHISGISQNTFGLFYQITAAINSGNSGGPSVDEHGNVIGINSAKIALSDNTAFMIPIAHIHTLLPDLYSNKVIKTHFGYIAQQTTQPLLDAYKCPVEGILTTCILKGSLPDKAGLKKGDIVTAINGYQLDSYGTIKTDWFDFRVSPDELFNRLRIGDTFTITIWRNGEFKELTATLAATSDTTMDHLYPPFDSLQYIAFGGMVIQPIRMNHLELCTNKELSDPVWISMLLQNQTKLMKHRLTVTKIYNGSQAEQTRTLVTGSIIKKVNGKKVRTLEDLEEAVLSGTDEYIRIETSRNKFIAVIHIPTLLEEEDTLRQTHHYEESSLIQRLKEKFPAA